MDCLRKCFFLSMYVLGITSKTGEFRRSLSNKPDWQKTLDFCSFLYFHYLLLHFFEKNLICQSWLSRSHHFAAQSSRRVHSKQCENEQLAKEAVYIWWLENQLTSKNGSFSKDKKLSTLSTSRFHYTFFQAECITQAKRNFATQSEITDPKRHLKPWSEISLTLLETTPASNQKVNDFFTLIESLYIEFWKRWYRVVG